LEAVPFGSFTGNTVAIMLDHSNNADDQDNTNKSRKDVIENGDAKICQKKKINVTNQPQK